MKILEKGDATQKAESLWNAKMSEKVTRRPRVWGKKRAEELPGRGRGSFGILENSDERPGKGKCRTAPGKVWGKNRWV